MANVIRLEPWTEADGRVELAATLDLAGQSHRLWWRVPAEWRGAMTEWADPFVIGFLFPAITVGGEVEIAGRVSPSLLANLEAYVDIWRMWSPGRYQPVRFWSHDEVEPPVPSESDARVLPFSAGVDSCFTAFRHARGLAGRNSRRIGAAITLFGFDILKTEKNFAARYEQMRAGSAAMLGSLGVPFVELDTNFRTLPQFWRHSHPTQLASGLALFGGRFGGGLIPNSSAYTHLDHGEPRLGSHPLSDPFLGSDRFRIADDGGAHRRWEKVEAMRDWPEFVEHLRVCFGAAGNVGNCGRCEKCYRTAIAFRIAGREPPGGLPLDVSPNAVRHIRVTSGTGVGYWRDLAVGVRARGQEEEPWAKAIRVVLRRAQRVQIAKQIKGPFLPIRNEIRRLFRGTTMSRSQLAAAQRAATSEA